MGLASGMKPRFPFSGSDQTTSSLWVVILSCAVCLRSETAELVFSLQLEESVGLLDGPLILPCPVYESTQEGEPVVRWETESGKFLPALDTAVQGLSNGSLFFPHLREEDLGTYSCTSRRGTGWVTGRVRVKKAGMEGVFFNPESQEVPEGHSAFLQCVSGDSEPPASISWEKDGVIVTKGMQIQGQYGGGSEKKTSATLHLANVSKDDEGEYKCVTFNPLLRLRIPSEAATLTVRGSAATPEITEGPENTTAVAGADAVLRCAARGSPVPPVLWFKDDEPLPNDPRRCLSRGGQLLVIRQVSKEDEGFYRCEARGQRHTARSRPAFLQIAAMDRSFVRQPADVTAWAGDSVTLDCGPPRSRPPALVSWFKNSRPLSPTPHFTQQPNGSLLYHRVQETDRGTYFCRATNSVLSRSVTSREVFLNVLAPPAVKVRPTAVTAPPGSEVTLQCLVSGHPPPTVVWSKQGRSVHTGGRVILGRSNATLYFSSVKVYDEGFYTCEAKNSVGQAKETASLHVSGEGTAHISGVRPSDAGDYRSTVENHAGRAQRSATVLVCAEEDSAETERVTAAGPTDKTPGSQTETPNAKFTAASGVEDTESHTSGHSSEPVNVRTSDPSQQRIGPSRKPAGFAVVSEWTAIVQEGSFREEVSSSQVSPREKHDSVTQVSQRDTFRAVVTQTGLGGESPWASEPSTGQLLLSDLSSTPSASHSQSPRFLSSSSNTYSQHISDTLPSDISSQSLSSPFQTPGPQTTSTHPCSPPTYSDAPPRDHYSQTETSHFQPPEIKTLPPDFSPPTTSHTLSLCRLFPAFSSFSKSSKLKSLPTNLHPSPPHFHLNSRDNKTLTSDPHVPHPTSQSQSPHIQTLSSFFESPSVAPPAQPFDLQTPPHSFPYSPSPSSHPQFHKTWTSFLHSSHPTSHSPPFHSFTPPPALQSPSSNHQTHPIYPHFSPPTTYAQPPHRQTSPPFHSATFQSQPSDPQTPSHHNISPASYPPSSSASHTPVPPSDLHPLSPSTTVTWKSEVISTVTKQQDWSPSPIPDKPSDAELMELLKRNTSQAPMRTGGDTARVKRQYPLSWLPTLEKHDIPIVVGVGVSLTFIFIAMAFYSLVQKNDPTPAGRAAQRHLGAPCRRSARPPTGRTYENRAFEDDDLVTVVEHSPSILGMRVPTPPPGAATVTTDPAGGFPTEQNPLPSVNLELDHCDEFQVEPHVEREKRSTSQPNLHLQCSKDWRKCQDVPLPPASSPKPLRDEGVHTSLNLQTVEPSTGTPDHHHHHHHHVGVSHGSGPLLLSHCVSVGVTTVAVDVHFYPAGPIPVRPGSRLADDPDAE